MGASPNGSLKKIVSLDETYRNMFKLSRNNSLYFEGIYKDFIIVYSLDYEDDSHVNINNINYYYINKNEPKKIFLFSADYYYEISDTINEYEFILSSDGTNVVANQWDEAHKVRCIFDKETGIFQVIGK